MVAEQAAQPTTEPVDHQVDTEAEEVPSEDDQEEVVDLDEEGWDQNYEPPGPLSMVAAGVFGVLCLTAMGLSIAAGADKDLFKRNDKYHPNAISLHSDQRHFHFLRPFLGSSCIDFTLRESEGTLPSEIKDSGLWKCTFEVPYAAVWGAMASAFFGLAAVCIYARSVLSNPRGTDKMHKTAQIIHDAAVQFLHQEYMFLIPYVVAMGLFIFFAIDATENDWVPSASVSFLFGSALSASCGYMGMHLATQGNCRTAAACYSDKETGLSRGLQVAFRTGACMGIGVVSCGVLGLSVTYAIFANTNSLGGFGFGASAVALFARVGGGIYTKAADVGADLCGKVDKDLGEDSPKNPATIADCVGDNVGDVAGMGADLFESFVGSIIAASVLGAAEFGTDGVAYPFYLAMIGLVVSVICTVYVNVTGTTLADLLKSLRLNVIAAGCIIVIVTLFLSLELFKQEADFIDHRRALDDDFSQRDPGARLFGCVLLGLVVGILIGMVTEFFTSHEEYPTQSIGHATEYGPGPVIIQGLGMGMYSTVVPLALIVSAVLGAFYLAGFYGTAIACVGMLSTLGVTMSTDAYGPVSDNAGGIAEMAKLPGWVREHTDALDALGNTTAATGKGFANGSAVLSAIALMTAFARVAGIREVDLMRPVVVIGLLVGALLPYMFGAMTMLSVNKAAQEMMFEVRRQFLKDNTILSDAEDAGVPDYDRCIQISCRSSLKEMLLPGVLATFAPLIVGFLFGSHALVGLLIGAIASGYLLGVEMSNTGGAWDNAKKWIEADQFVLGGIVQGKGTDCHKAAVCGDTVGDPFKDTSGPALNILIKLMAGFSYVMAPIFEEGWGLWYVGIYLVAAAAVIVALLWFFVLNRSVEVEETEPAENQEAGDTRRESQAADARSQDEDFERSQANNMQL